MKYAIVTILLWMNSIQLSSGFTCKLDLTGMCDLVTEEIPEIVSKVSDIPDILDDVEDVLKMVNQIPELLEVIMLLLENPFSVTDILPPDVNELAETLETCMDPVKDLLDPFSAIYEALLKNLPEMEMPDFIPELPDIEDLIYKAVAFALLPYKEAVDNTCNSILPGAVNVLKTALTGSRRRMEEEIRPEEKGICEHKGIEDYCESKPFEWTHNKGGLYESGTSLNAMIDKSEKEKGCIVNSVIDHKIAKFTMNMFGFITDIVLWIFEQTIPEEVKNVNGYNELSKIQQKLADIAAKKAGKLVKCPHCTNMGKAIKFFVVFVNHILDFVMAQAAQHNGVLTRTKINAIFNDRIAILHNQKAILHVLENGLIGTSAKIDGETSTLVTGLKSIEKIEGNIETLIRYQQRFDEKYGTLPPTSQPIDSKMNVPAKEEVSIRNDEFGLDIQPKGDATSFITITLSMRELYSLVAVTIGFGSLCIIIGIVIGIVIGKCCLNVYKTNGGFAPLPKYDYATSDVEDASK